MSEKLTLNFVSTLAPSFLIGSSSFLQVSRTAIKSRMSSKYGPFRPQTVELAALERLENAYAERNVMSTLLPTF